MRDLKFLLLTPQSVAICETVDELYWALKKRSRPYGEVYTADNYHPLQHLANIKLQCYHDTNSDEKNKVDLLALPANITQSIALVSNHDSTVENQDMVAYVSQGGWAVNALNGFYAATTDEELCGRLYEENFLYPVAQWLNGTYEQLVWKARYEYVRRFYSRYFYNAECTILPQCWIEYFIDPYFKQREDRRAQYQVSSEDWRNFQEVKTKMSWLI